MNYTDEQVAAAMRGMYDSFGELREDMTGPIVTFETFMTGPVSTVTDEETYTFDRIRLEAMARAALESIEQPVSLEEVLMGWSVLGLHHKADSSSWAAIVHENAGNDDRSGHSSGPTIDAAIRNAVAAAKGGAS